MLNPGNKVLIVGAGFAGAVHARVLADAGVQVELIDRRPHIAGNAYDKLDERGVRVHVYGPHLFHTNNKKVVDFLARFGEFVPYEHRVTAEFEGSYVSFPINRTTFEQIFNRSFATEEELSIFIGTLAEPIASPTNAGEFLRSKIGSRMTDLFFRTYTKKMWGLDLEQMDAAVVKRVPIRTDRDDRYFPSDQFQMLPKYGYTEVVRAIMDHPLINTQLGVVFQKSMESSYDLCFLSCPIDEYFDYRFGELPYRSIKFHHAPTESAPTNAATVNYTDASPFTRETYWHLLPNHDNVAGGPKTRTIEEPCDYKDNNLERYYPVRDAEGIYAARYREYAELAKNFQQLRFIGRCGCYTYLDMHQVIAQSLIQAKRELK
jgi:UDP-galactopyranose mutase